MALLDEIERRALASLIPPPRLPLSQWIEANLRLPEGTSALPGPVRLWPYQREIADAIGDPEIERVTLVKSVRVGFTTLMTGAVAAFVANEPAPILALLPTEKDCRDYVVSEVEPIFDATPVLAGLLSGDLEEGVRNTLLSRRFPGGSLKVVAAKSPRNLRRHTARILFVDEADAMEPGAEGSPITLAERRTLSFGDRKIVIGSTPTLEETSNVLRAYAASDRRVFEVPCPDCGGHTEIEWRHIRWEAERPETAAFACPHCGSLVDERHKPAMVDRGRWRATAPEVVGHAGFRLSALVSLLPNAAWGKLAAEFTRAKDDPGELQVFVNTILAQGWTGGDLSVDPLAIAARAEKFGLDEIPPEVLWLTAGVDVQDDRLETTVLGWTRDGVILVLGHDVIIGSPGDDTTWRELDELLRTRWPHPLGGRLGLDAAIIDSGDGDWTATVYGFCFPRAGRRVLAGKGMFGGRLPLAMSKHDAKGGRVWIVGVDGIKANLADRIAREAGIRFSSSLPATWFEQITAERRVTRRVRGAPVRRWDRIPGAAAEALDCTVYAIAARQVVTIDAARREDELRGAPAPSAPPRTSRSRWMER